MTKSQARRARQLYAESSLEHGGVSRTFKEILDSLNAVRTSAEFVPLIITTDEKPEYVRVIDRHPLFRAQNERHRVIHQTINSHAARNYANPLFASNYLDREIRKDTANHHRETVCFSRNVANGLCRLACYLFHHNYIKRFSIKAPYFDKTLHGEAAGIPRPLIDKEFSSVFFRKALLYSIEALANIRKDLDETVAVPAQEKSRVCAWLCA